MKANQFAKADDAQVGIGTMVVFIATVLVAAVAAGVLISVGGNLQSQSTETGTQATEEISRSLSLVRVFGEDITGVAADTFGDQTSTDDGAVGGTNTIVPQDLEDANADDDEIDELHFLVQLAPGSQPFNLSEAKVIIQDGDQALTYQYTGLTDVVPEAVAGAGSADGADGGDAEAGEEGNYFTVAREGTDSSDLTIERGDVWRIRVLGTWNEDGDDGFRDPGTDTVPNNGVSGDWGDRLGIQPGEEFSVTIQLPGGSPMFIELKAPNVMDDNYEQLY